MDYSLPVHKRLGANLPHWRQKDGIYSVTFRLGDSLPLSVVREWALQRKDILTAIENGKRRATANELEELEELSRRKIDEHLKRGKGACWLQKSEIATIVAETLKKYEGMQYRLYAWCIMPNHVHVIVQPIQEHTLEKIMHAWKSVTAHAANKILKRKGIFWQAEYYDHLIRNLKDLDRCIEYTWRNPEEAGLKGWKWRWRYDCSRTGEAPVQRL